MKSLFKKSAIVCLLLLALSIVSCAEESKAGEEAIQIDREDVEKPGTQSVDRTDVDKPGSQGN